MRESSAQAFCQVPCIRNPRALGEDTERFSFSYDTPAETIVIDVTPWIFGTPQSQGFLRINSYFVHPQFGPLGLASAEHITLALIADDSAVRTTAIVDQPNGPDGLLASSTTSTPRKLLSDLPPLSLAAMTIAVDPARLRALVRADAHVAGASFGGGLAGGCRAFGLDFEDQVLPRLAGSGGVQLVLLDDAARDQDVAFSIAARSAASARLILTELREGFERFRPGARELRVDRDVLTIGFPGGETSIGVVGDSLVLAPRRATIERLAVLERQGARDRSRSRTRTQDLCERILASRPAAHRAPIGVVQIDGSWLSPDAATPGRRHAGLLFLDDGSLRVELISPR